MLTTLDMAELLSPQQAGDLLGVSSDRIRQLVALGQLTCHRTAAGWRLIERRSVEALAAQRKARELVG